MVYLLKMVIFHGYVSHNQMVNVMSVESQWVTKGATVTMEIFEQNFCGSYIVDLKRRKRRQISMHFSKHYRYGSTQILNFYGFLILYIYFEDPTS
jgi:hypothetical protein